MSDHLLNVEGLRVSFETYAGEVQAVRGVSFYLDGGETLAIVGESGCGKSVTVQTIMRLNPEPPAAVKGGSILYKGEELTKKTDKQMRAYRGKEFSMIFQDAMTSLNPVSRIGRQMVEAIRVHETIRYEDAKKRAIEMLGKVGLSNPETVYRRYPHTLSGGQRQRVMIAMALCCHPSILLADEPTTALDVTTQAQILELMKDIQKETGCGIILITHNLGVVARMADRVGVMYAGQMVEKGTLDDIFYHPKTRIPGDCSARCRICSSARIRDCFRFPVRRRICLRRRRAAGLRPAARTAWRSVWSRAPEKPLWRRGTSPAAGCSMSGRGIR